MSSYTLKAIAIVAMVIDHTFWASLPNAFYPLHLLVIGLVKYAF